MQRVLASRASTATAAAATRAMAPPQPQQHLRRSARGAATAANANATNANAANANAANAAPTPATPTTTTPLPAPFTHHVKNFRDLALHTQGLVRPGLLYRCAGPTRATEQDAALLFGALGVRELLDLRSRDELELEGCASSPAFRGASFAAYSRDPVTGRSLPDPRATVISEAWAWPGGGEARARREAATVVLGGDGQEAEEEDGKRKRPAANTATAAAATAAATAAASDDGCVLRRHIPLLQKRRYFRALMKRMPVVEAAKVAAQLVVDRRAAMARVLSIVNAGGLECLYEIILEESGPELAACCHAALLSLERNRPLLFFCKAGKDRTGLLAALMLLSSGVPRELVLADYHASDKYHALGLAGLEREPGLAALDKAVFERAPVEAMEYALGFLDRITAGGGASAYLEKHGFGRDAQAQLRDVLMVGGGGGGGGDGGGGKRARTAAGKARL